MLAISLGRNQSFKIHEPISTVFTLRSLEPEKSATFQLDLGTEKLTILLGTDHKFEYAHGLWGTLSILKFTAPFSGTAITKVVVGLKLPRAIKVTF